MYIATHAQWADEKKLMLEEENPVIECAHCSGDGVIYDRCHCCGNEQEEDCQICDGRGRIKYSESPKPRPGSDLIGRQVYFREVINDLKAWCGYTRQDFLAVAGSFVNQYRAES